MRDDQVWKALADPTRRAILDRLRIGEATTGELCKPFSVSRFAVMKHLAILESAGLVVVRRRGRERWNHLNAVPIREIFERWVHPFSEHWAAGLIQLKSHVEKENAMTASPATVDCYSVVTVELEVTIKGGVQRVWDALTSETAKWWPREFYTGAPAMGFHIECWLGGRMYEDWGDGAGLVWATVIGIFPRKSLTLLGQLFPAFGGPAISMLELTLTKLDNETTVLRVSDTVSGRVGDDKAAQTREGWVFLFDGGLRPYVERNP